MFSICTYLGLSLLFLICCGYGLKVLPTCIIMVLLPNFANCSIAVKVYTVFMMCTFFFISLFFLSLLHLFISSLVAREDAVSLGKELVRRHFIHHVTYEHDFEDDYLFYRLLEDIKTRSLNAGLSHHCVRRKGN